MKLKPSVSVVGSGSVNLNNSGLYYYGDVVELTAVPSAGWIFDHWSGDLSGSTSPTKILITGNKGVTATFIFKTPVGGYSVSISTRNTAQPAAAYAALVCLFGAILVSLRRKKK